MVQLFSKSCSLAFLWFVNYLLTFSCYLLELTHAASLGVASQILVTIAASDHAHGIFEFSPESLFVSGTEPEDGYSTVTLNVSTVFPPLLDTFCSFKTVLLYYESVLYVIYLFIFSFLGRGEQA